MPSVEQIAYARWEARGRRSGDDWADWFAAEAHLRNMPRANAATNQAVLDQTTIRSWPEWALYVADPCHETLTRLDRKAQASGRPPLLRNLEAEVAAGASWKIAQHASLYHHDARRLTEAWYFAHLAAVRSNGDVRSNIALAQVYEARRLPYAVIPVLDTIRRQLRRVPRRERRRFQAYVAEAYVRTYAYVRNTTMAVRWWRYVRRQPGAQATTLIQFLLAIWLSEYVEEARDVAVRLLPAMATLGPRVRARVVGALRFHLLQVLRARR